MKIQLKRSNVIDGGAAKEPTALQMEFGELAVNYNSADPAIFLKDHDGNIIRIAGNDAVGNVPDDIEGYPDLGDGNGAALDSRYVLTVGDNMTGNLTLGGDKITLNASNGSAEFATDKFQIASTGAQKIIGTGFGNAGMFHLQNDGVWQAIITGAGRLTLGGNAASPGTANITLDGEDGSAEFAGVVTASNITAFKSNLKTSIQNATDLDAVKTAIIDALNNHL